IMPYVPHRVDEGYGLSKKGIDFIKGVYNAKLIITVDHGISAVEKVKYADSLGIDTIILDHHLKPAKLPKAKAIIHTTELAAGGIAWFFCNYLISKLKGKSYSVSFTSGESFGHPRGGFKALLQKTEYLLSTNLDLAALATIADLVPLTFANRAIVKFGLEQLNKTERVGFTALIKEAGLKKGDLGVYEVGHILAPRINSMGRLMHAIDALRLLCTRDKERASALAKQLSSTNRERQVLTETATIQAIEMVRHEQLTKLLFISRKEFKEGIIGLVAGKLVEEFYRPAIVVSQGEIFSKASARSVNGFNIVETLHKASELLEDVGGHPMAAGFTVATKNLTLLKSKLQKIATRELDKEKLTRSIKVDMILNLKNVTTDFYNKLQQFAPFGVGNPEPTFASYNAEVIGASLVGRDRQHLKMKVQCRDSSYIFEAIGFSMGDVFRKIVPHQLIDIAYSIDENRWNGNLCLQLKLKDVKFPQQ
ncbi:hypothetical protein HZB96_03045, partial [Candidatus Gottesmanbacteria bacterium]|nr:hypothetical protein [Candidatus Gottesmanbacteria bacterium]